MERTIVRTLPLLELGVAVVVIAASYIAWRCLSSRRKPKERRKGTSRAMAHGRRSSQLELSTKQPVRRRFECPQSIVSACIVGPEEASAKKYDSGKHGFPESKEACARREWVVQAATSNTPVPLPLWVAYRDWVDRSIANLSGSTDNWHRFAYARALGLHSDCAADATGGDAADLLACLAACGLLHHSEDAGSEAAPDGCTDLLGWLTSASAAFNGRFTVAAGRGFKGYSREEEGEWGGEYDFIQLADPQLGMLHSDREWTEELTMLRLSVQHVNALRPRFLLVSGDLINAFPSQDPNVSMRQVASFKEALRDLDPSIPLVMQPGNHDIGQVPNPEDILNYCERFGDDYYSFWVGGVFYLSLNSQYYCNTELAVGIAPMREEQDAWLQAQLEQAKGVATHIVILSHVPPFVGDEQESSGWANWEVAHRARVLAAAHGAGAALWLCGHYHGNCTATSTGNIEVVVSSSCGAVINWIRDAPHVATQPRPDFATVVGTPSVVSDAHHCGLRYVRVTRERIRHRWFTLAGVPETLEQVDAVFRAMELGGAELDASTTSMLTRRRPLSEVLGLTDASMHGVPDAGIHRTNSMPDGVYRDPHGAPLPVSPRLRQTWSRGRRATCGTPNVARSSHPTLPTFAEVHAESSAASGEASPITEQSTQEELEPVQLDPPPNTAQKGATSVSEC